MRTFRDVSRDIAQDVAAGKLAPGSALPSVRTAAMRHDTTAATVARAHRALADAGVIATADRRRARVAPDGVTAAARLLGTCPAPPPTTALHLAGSDDPGLDIAVRAAGASVVTVGPRGSFHG